MRQVTACSELLRPPPFKAAAPGPATAPRGDHRRQEPRAGGRGKGLTRGQFPTGDPVPSPTEAGRGWAGGGRKARLVSSSETPEFKGRVSRPPPLASTTLALGQGSVLPLWDKRTVTSCWPGAGPLGHRTEEGRTEAADGHGPLAEPSPHRQMKHVVLRISLLLLLAVQVGKGVNDHPKDEVQHDDDDDEEEQRS